MNGKGNGAAAPAKDRGGAVNHEEKMPRSISLRNPRALALLAQAHAHRLLADAEESEAHAIENQSHAPDLDALLTERTWPSDLPVSFRAIHEAGRRGEIAITRAGRTPSYRRGDVLDWLSTRTKRRPLREVTSPDSANEYDAIVSSITASREKR